MMMSPLPSMYDASNIELQPSAQADAAKWRAALDSCAILKQATLESAEDSNEEQTAWDRFHDAVEEMIRTPAPDAGAVCTKLAMGRDRYDGSVLPDDFLDAIAADLCRLAGH